MVNKIFVLFIIFFNFSFADVMLLKNYKGNENISGWVMSEKLDGVRGYWTGKDLISRSNKSLNPPKFWIKNFPPFAIDGEIYSNRGEFDKISSIIRDKKDKSDWIMLKFYIFDVPDAKGNLSQRLEVLKNYLSTHIEIQNIKIIDQIPIKDKTQLLNFLDEVVDGGGEGVVLRDPNANYEHIRSDKILKLKKYLDSECEILEIYKGKGKYKDMIGSFLCKDIKNNVEFKIGSGMSDTIRANGLRIGDIITYKFLNFTKNNKPRFASFLRVKQRI